MTTSMFETMAVRARAPAHKQEIEEKREFLIDELRRLEEILKMEEDDVNKLTKMSVNTMFRLFLQGPERQLEIEQQEYLIAVQVSHSSDIASFKHQHELLTSEVDQLQQERRQHIEAQV